MKKLLVAALLFAASVVSGEPLTISHTSPGEGWEDLRFPANGINPVGAAADPARDTTDGLLSFSGSADNVIAIQAQMPHGWHEGTSLCPHLHLLNTAATAGSSSWRLEWKIANIGGDFPALWASETINVDVPAATSTHIMPMFTDIGMTGRTRSAMLIMKLSRLGSSDAYAKNIKLLEFDIHYRHYRFGD